jgi:hypothetical protein
MPPGDPWTRVELPAGLELRVTSPLDTGEGADPARPYRLTGAVAGPGVPALREGGSVCVLSLATGLAAEAFLDPEGGFAADVELLTDTDNDLELTVCDSTGEEIAHVSARVRHRTAGGSADQAERSAPLVATPPPAERGRALDPPRPRLEQLVRHCLDLAATVADRTGRNREELFEHVYAQERYAEQAWEKNDQPLYRECFDNLTQYAGYLEQLLEDNLPRPRPPQPSRPPEEWAREELEDFRGSLAEVWRRVRNRGRSDLEGRLAQVARQGQGLAQRVKTDARGVIGDVRRLGAEVEEVARQLDAPPPAPDEDGGLLEGSA